MPKIVDREKRKKKILEAAFALFVEHGYHKATLNSIAHAAGMRQGTLYYYFPTKDEIFWAVYQSLMEKMGGMLLERLATIDEAQQRLQEMLKILFLNFPEVGFYEEENDAMLAQEAGMIGFHYVLMEFWLYAKRNDKEEDFYQRLAHHHQQIVQLLEGLFHEVGVELPPELDEHSAAHLIFAMRDGFSIQMRVGTITGEGPVLTQCRDFIFNTFLGGLLPPTNTK